MHILTVFVVCFHYESPCGCDCGIGIRETYCFHSDAQTACRRGEGEYVEERKALDVDGKLFLLDKNIQEFDLSEPKQEVFTPEDKAKHKGVEI